MIDRRSVVVACLLGLGLVGLDGPPADAQPVARQRVVGYLGNSDARIGAPQVGAFKEGLRERGWIEGKTVRIEYRWVEGHPDRLPELVGDLVRLKVDVLVVSGPPAVRAASDATRTIPIVIAAMLVDPVAAGFVESFARPGGNITGVASEYETIVTKQLQFLAEAVTPLSRVAVLRHRTSPPITARAATGAAERLGIKAQVVEVGDPTEYESAFRAARSAGAQAMHVLPNPAFNAHRRQLIDLAARYRLPAVYEFRDFVEDGGLLSYGVNIADMFRMAAGHVDRIFKGARAGDLPIERPTKFELAINVKTAGALGLTLPPSLLQRADHVVE